MKKLIRITGSSKRLILYISLLTGLILQGQNAISGTVSDANSTLPGVNILIKGTSNGTLTDLDGNYTLNNLTNGATLVFTYLGYKTKEVVYNGQTTVNIVLIEDTQALNEVVVIGYGTSARKDLTGAISSVSSKSFEAQPVFRPEDALQSRAAGVSVVKNSGAPGSNIKIRIRGSNSITGNNAPLVVIDGVIGGDLSTINTDDIQSMDILKDASASAIYGSRGANGVIIITTKKGGGEPKVEAKVFSTISSTPKRVSLISPEEHVNLFGGEVINGGTDYQEEYFRTAILNNVQVSANGKEGNLSYFLSTNYVDQEGSIINSDYERYSLRANLNTTFGDKLSVGLNLFGTREGTHNLFNGGARASGDARGGILGILGWDPSIPFRNADGTYNLESSGGSILVNPLAVQIERDNNNISDRFNANLDLNYKFTNSFSYRLVAATILGHSFSESFSGIPSGTSVLPPRASFGSSRLTSYQLSHIFTWNKSFGKSNLKLTGLYELTNGKTRIGSGSSGDFAIGGLTDAFYLLELGIDPNVSADLAQSTIQSYMGRAEYNLNDNFLLTGTIRVDQSSKFRKENNTGYFPSVSAAYNFGDLLPEDGFISNIKARASYGEVGNEGVSPLSTFSILRTGNNFAFDGVNAQVGLRSPQLVDRNLTWETTVQTNFALDFTAAKGNLLLTLEYFNKNTIDLLLDKPIPLFQGGGTLRTNIGEVKNAGFEANIQAYLYNSEKFSWNANFNLSNVVNEVVSLGGDQTQILLVPDGVSPGGRSDNLYAIEVGQPLGQFYGSTFLGTYKTADAAIATPGSARYLVDDDGNNVLGVIGNGTPTLTWGLNNTFNYKKLDLNILIRGVHDFDVYNATYTSLVLPGGNAPVARHSDYLNRWTPENETEIPASGDNVIASTRSVEKGDFIRLSNVSLGYSFNNLRFIDNLKLYISGQNLFTITDYTGLDPEVSSTRSSSDDAPSFDFGAIPNPRNITLGINIGF